MNRVILPQIVFFCFFTFNNIFAVTTIVQTIGQLNTANSSANSGDTIVLKDGTYQVQSYAISVRTDNLTFRSESGNREKVIVCGAGMNGDIEYGFWISGNNVTIKDLTIQDVHYHCIQTDVNNDGLHVTNCILRDANEQLLKIPYDVNLTDFSENGIVENCLFDFTAGIANQYYTGGVDCHYGKNWIIRNNVFKNIRSPDGEIAEHAIHFWSGSEGTLAENNLIINCDRGIGYGLGDRGHKGGIIRNNMIYHGVISGNDNGDAGIILETSPGTQVYNNTIYFENDYPNAVEYRFAATSGVLIQNNLSNKTIRQRDNASGTVSNNSENAEGSWFKDVSKGDLHLKQAVSSVVDKGIAIDKLTTDFDGDARISTSIDLGADEYKTSTIIGTGRQKAPEAINVKARILKFSPQYHAEQLNVNNQGFDLIGRILRENVFSSGMVLIERKSVNISRP